MKYITFRDLTDTIRRNIWKVPRDIDFIIGIPRSGMIAAGIISSFLNVPLIDLNSFLAGQKPSGGHRLHFFTDSHVKTGKALVVDDTVWHGNAMKEARAKLADRKDLKFIYACVFLEGRGRDMVDIFFRDITKYTDNYSTIVVYEWNIFQHNEKFMEKCLYDMDGVLCVNPPDERNEKEYQKYIRNATPLFIPRTKIGGIITYRLQKNRHSTEEWLRQNNILHNGMIMFPADSWQERKDTGVTPEQFKGRYYKAHDEFRLFVESDDTQARRIAEISGKQVYCVETNRIYP